MKRWLLVCVLSTLGACSGNQQKSAPESTAALDQWPNPVGIVDLRLPATETAEVAALDIGLVIFDPGVPRDPARTV